MEYRFPGCVNFYTFHFNYCLFYLIATPLIKPSVTAVDAFKQLRHWVQGFVKNSRNRHRGVDIFFEPSERQELEEIEVVLRTYAPTSPPLDFLL